MPREPLYQALGGGGSIRTTASSIPARSSPGRGLRHLGTELIGQSKNGRGRVLALVGGVLADVITRRKAARVLTAPWTGSRRRGRCKGGSQRPFRGFSRSSLGEGAAVDPVPFDSSSIFRAFAELLRRRRDSGVMTTEGSVRYTFFATLAGDALLPERVVLEYPHPTIARAEIDTVILAADGGVAVRV